MLKILALLIVLMTVGCGASQEVVIPENPTALPPEDVMQVGDPGTAGATDTATPPPLRKPGE